MLEPGTQEILTKIKDAVHSSSPSNKASETSNLVTKSCKVLQETMGTWDATKATNIPTAVLNLVKSLLGAAMLSLPWAFSQSTFIPGVIGLGFSVIYSFITVMLVVNACDATNTFEYSALLKYVHPYWETAASITVIYVALSSCLSYVILIGDFFTDGIHGLNENFAFKHDREIYKAVICCCVLLPLSLLRELKSLKASSIIGNSANLYCVILAIAFTVSQTYSASNSPKAITAETNGFVWNDWNYNILIVTNICAKGYASQYPVCPMYEQLKHRSVARMRIVVICAFSIVTCIYVTFAVCGYYLYGSSTQGDVLLSYPSDNIYFIIARFAMGFSIIGTYPFIFKSLLQCIEDKFFSFKKGTKYNFVDYPRVRTFVICACGLALMVIAIVVNNVGPVSSIEGAVTILCLMSLFPILMAWKIDTHDTTHLDDLGTTYGVIVNENVETKRRSRKMIYVIYLGMLMFVGFAVGMAGITLQIVTCAIGKSGDC